MTQEVDGYSEPWTQNPPTTTGGIAVIDRVFLGCKVLILPKFNQICPTKF